VLIYFLTGLAASLTSFMRLGPFASSVGASGAIFGVMGAFIFSVWRSPRWRHDPVARSIVKQAIFWMIANIVIGLNIPQIDNAAHIGGLVAGMLLGAILPHPAAPPPPPAQVVVDVSPYDG
jgi:rhomboid protease GluP